MNEFAKYFLRFLLTFCLIYYGTIGMIGITSPAGYYSAFADHYFNYVSALRWILLNSSSSILRIMGYPVYLSDIYTIKFQGGLGVHIGYDCIGYGVMSFWIAFIIANQLSFLSKLKWGLCGLLLIFVINVVRISMMLVAVNGHWKSFLSLDNHSWFNIAAYIAIFTMMWFFDKAQKKVGRQVLIYRKKNNDAH